VTDGCPSYNGVNATRRQGCLCHLIRHGEDIGKEIDAHPGKELHTLASQFCADAVTLFQKACKVGKDFREGKRNWEIEAPLLEKQFDKDLDTLCASPVSYTKAETFRKRLIGKERKHWFTFMRYPNIDPTNNLAERALRPLVIRRKTSFGTRSEAGSKNIAVLNSLTQTVKLQGGHALEFFKILLTEETSNALNALFQNDSLSSNCPEIKNTT